MNNHIGNRSKPQLTFIIKKPENPYTKFYGIALIITVFLIIIFILVLPCTAGQMRTIIAEYVIPALTSFTPAIFLSYTIDCVRAKQEKARFQKQRMHILSNVLRGVWSFFRECVCFSNGEDDETLSWQDWHERYWKCLNPEIASSEEMKRASETADRLKEHQDKLIKEIDNILTSYNIGKPEMLETFCEKDINALIDLKGAMMVRLTNKENFVSLISKAIAGMQELSSGLAKPFSKSKLMKAKTIMK